MKNTVDNPDNHTYEHWQTPDWEDSQHQYLDDSAEYSTSCNCGSSIEYAQSINHLEPK